MYATLHPERLCVSGGGRVGVWAYKPGMRKEGEYSAVNSQHQIFSSSARRWARKSGSVNKKRVFRNSLKYSFSTSRNMSGRLDHRLSRRRDLCSREKPVLFPSGVYGGKGTELERKGRTHVPIFLLCASVLERRVVGFKVTRKPKFEGLRLCFLLRTLGGLARTGDSTWRSAEDATQ